jgi:hypothetical protein
MSMKRLAVAVVAVATLALSPGALAARVPNGKYRGKITSGFLKGTWTIAFFKKGSSYKVTGPYGSLTGKSKFSGSTVTFSHESEGTICHGPGKYKYKLTSKTLKLRPIRETCPVRAKVYAPTFRKVG